MKTQLSRACGSLSTLKHCTTQSVLKVVYNSLIHPYRIYSILNWGRSSTANIQPLIKLQNKGIKLIRPTNQHGISRRIFPALKHLMPPQTLYCTLSVGKFIHSYYTKLLPNHFDDFFIPIFSITSHSTSLWTSNNLFLPRVNASSAKMFPYICCPKSVVFNIRLHKVFYRFYLKIET